MNAQDLRNEVVEQAKKDLGAKQYSERHKAIIRDFNRIPGMGSWMTTNYAWCAAAVSVWGFRAGMTDYMFPSASCNDMIRKYRAAGRWVENDDYRPQPGDVIMYDWEDSGSGDDTGEADHTGIVETVQGAFLTVIEGNKNNAVGRRTLLIGGRYIRGYCVPDYARAAGEKQEDPKEWHTWTKNLQRALNRSYHAGLVVDGKEGPKTDAVIAEHYLYFKWPTIENEHVEWLQRALNKLGADMEPDGSFGPATEAALLKFQAKNDLEADGFAGIKTHEKILQKLGE